MSCAMFQTGLWGFSLGGCLVLVTPSCPKTSQTKIANKRHYQYFLSLYFICYCLISAFISLLPCFSLFLSLSLCSLNTAVGDVFTQASTPPPHTHQPTSPQMTLILLPPTPRLFGGMSSGSGGKVHSKLLHKHQFLDR